MRWAHPGGSAGGAPVGDDLPAARLTHGSPAASPSPSPRRSAPAATSGSYGGFPPAAGTGSRRRSSRTAPRSTGRRAAPRSTRHAPARHEPTAGRVRRPSSPG
ncbi:hypothetical protein [Ornithinimicrobium kibberense]|uniref:hypothetical protein n=1 Tax=Ornithinimicrobium kibberense TaxID=282060 RepID=UPI00361EF87E